MRDSSRGFFLLALTFAAACAESTEPTATVAFTSVTAGNHHACGLDTGGRVWCWGDNTHGQLGSARETCYPGALKIPVTCPELARRVETPLLFTAVDAGDEFTCGIAIDGAAYCWGLNAHQQLGAPSTSLCDSQPCGPSPLKVSGGNAFTRITVGAVTTCGVTATHVGRCWGSTNLNSLFGTSFTSTESLVPLPVTFTTGDSTWESFSGPSLATTCGVTAAHRVACWGDNTFGQLGTGNAVATKRPTLVPGLGEMVAVTVGGYATCALDAAGTAMCWGLAAYGLVGDGTSTGPMPCMVPYSGNLTCTPTPTVVTGGHQFRTIDAGFDHVCGVTAPDGDVYCWGKNLQAQLGSGAIGGLAGTPAVVTGGHHYTSVSAGNQFTCGLTTDKEIWCWGQFLYGQSQTGTNRSVTPWRIFPQ